MSRRLSQIWRFPIKSHGREQLRAVDLTAGQALPWDRHWAVAHTESDADGTQWVSGRNFSLGTKAAALGGIAAALDEATGTVTLTHPERDPLTFSPDTEGEKLIAWTQGFIPENRAQSDRVVRGQSCAFVDSEFQSVTLGNLASHRAVEAQVGQSLSPLRWRGNLWIDGGDAWEEHDWLGREIRIGEAVLIPRERTVRCLATHNNPDTGQRDVNVLAALDAFGHRDFTVRCEVIRSGTIAEGDSVEIL